MLGDGSDSFRRGDYNDLTEVLALAEAGQIKHSVTRVRWEDINETLEAMSSGAR